MGSNIYLLKVHGTGAEADYLQLRDSNMSLIGYIRCVPPYQGLKRLFEDEKVIDKISNTIGQLPYGKLTKIEL
ncbi:MAG TPA: hypothetical protein DG754_02680 [Bacteroidales bacterium]|jgi:hypothetical protein|nr:hypothetical protein [Bacteroidales bacterium]